MRWIDKFELRVCDVQRRRQSALDRELTDDTDRDPDHAEDEPFLTPSEAIRLD